MSFRHDDGGAGGEASHAGYSEWGVIFEHCDEEREKAPGAAAPRAFSSCVSSWCYEAGRTSISLASRSPLGLSLTITIRPRAGVEFHSVRLMVTPVISD